MFMQLSFTTLDDSFLSFDSDLALRNCLLTSEMSVKIGDYGLSQSRYKVRDSVISLIFIYCFLPYPYQTYQYLNMFLSLVVLFSRTTTM